MKHFISIASYSQEELRHILDVARQLKAQYKNTGRNDKLLADQTLAMIFEKPSLRTRVSFTTAMTQLGGSSMYLRQEEVGLDTREPVRDVARVISSMCDGIMARTFGHDRVLGLAQYSSVPVINGLTDYSHPCQAMTDIMTIDEHFGSLEGRTLVFVGDGNNVARSLATACGRFRMHFVLASPAGYELPADDIQRIRQQVPEMEFVVSNDPVAAVRQADVLYTDTWVSMGQELEKAKRLADFRGYCIDQRLLDAAPKHAIVLHCLPAYRGYEISDEAMEGPQSKVFTQAENRLHFQKGLLAVLMAGL
jgi:ornithine carbamoyltransferase